MATEKTAQKFLRLLSQARASCGRDAFAYPRDSDNPIRLWEVIDNLASCVVPRFYPIFKEVRPDKLDRKGSLIGGCGFISRAYPTPGSKEKPDAPLVQLDLDQIQATTGRDVGSGLLQVWLYESYWGQGVPTYCRRVPRGIVNRTKNLGPCQRPKIPKHVEEGCPDVDPDVLELVDPEAAEKLRYDIEYWGGVSGFEWRGQENLPIQIVDWKKDGFVIPQMQDYDVYNWIENGNCAKAEDYLLKACSLSYKEEGRRIVGLFEDNSNAGQFWPSQYDDTPSTATGWRPLFTFFGPASYDFIEDSHIVMYRKAGRKFEYVGGCTRWYG